MYSLRNIILLIGILGAVPMSLASPVVDEDGIAELDVAEFEQPELDVAEFEQPELEDRAPEALPLDADDVLAHLEARASCYVTKNWANGNRDQCAASTCNPSQYCELNKRRTGCKWKRGRRPSGCRPCKCAKYS